MILILLMAQGVDDLRASGVFKKVGNAWTAEKDVDVHDMRDNWVEKKFLSVAGVKLHAWARIGACCRETFSAYCQVSGGTVELRGKQVSIDPGGNMAGALKLPPDGMPREHKGHGEKRPERWIWAEIPLPDYAAAGPQAIRVMTDQKGFSVARVHVGRDPKPPAE